MSRKPIVSAIAAIGTQTRALGKGNALLWHLPSDLKFFREKTTGHPILMGRKTYESIGRPLPSRQNIVITRDESYKAEGVLVVHSIEDALAAAEATDEIFVIGGAEIYKQALPQTDRLYLTLIDDQGDGADVFFPEYPEFTKVVEEVAGEENGLTWRRVTLER